MAEHDAKPAPTASPCLESHPSQGHSDLHFARPRWQLTQLTSSSRRGIFCWFPGHPTSPAPFLSSPSQLCSQLTEASHLGPRAQGPCTELGSRLTGLLVPHRLISHLPRHYSEKQPIGLTGSGRGKGPDNVARPAVTHSAWDAQPRLAPGRWACVLGCLPGISNFTV